MTEQSTESSTASFKANKKPCSVCGNIFLPPTNYFTICSDKCRIKRTDTIHKIRVKRLQLAKPSSRVNRRIRATPIIEGDIARILVNEKMNLFSMIDAEDIHLLGNDLYRVDGRGYVRSISNTKRKSLHRVIMNVSNHMKVDHINHDRLDNRKSNLRIATTSQNNMNRKPKAEFKGIEASYSKSNTTWSARIKAQGKSFYLGSYATPEEAARAYDKAALIYHGEFAWLNFPKD